MNLAQIRASQRIGIWCRSREFLDIILRRLKEFNLPVTRVTHATGDDVPDVRDFLKTAEVLILPPGGLPTQDKAASSALQAFGDRGGRLIKFDYQIERGSLAHVEERIRELIRKRPSRLA